MQLPINRVIRQTQPRIGVADLSSYELDMAI